MCLAEWQGMLIWVHFKFSRIVLVVVGGDTDHGPRLSALAGVSTSRRKFEMHPANYCAFIHIASGR